MAPNRSVSPPADLINGNGASPPPQPQSKREKRRIAITDRLQEIISSFNDNVRPHYEAQANAIQVDINLILRNNPYENVPLEEDTEIIHKQIETIIGDKIPADSAAREEFFASAGKLYSEYVARVNDAMERRDIDLNMLHNKYQNSFRELHDRHQFQMQVATEEHRLLADTVRERLIVSLTKKKERLLKEKEQLDIGDSNAFLLHPNQFAIVNPASPGMGHKRATRGTGRRGHEGEESTTNNTNPEKRKRKNIYDEMDAQSPNPTPSRNENGSNTPYRDSRSRNEYHQHGAPAYSVDRIFTEKELQLTMNRAAVAATEFLVRLKSQKSGLQNGNSDAALAITDANRAAGGEDATSNVTPPTDVVMEDDPTAPVEMERTVSQSYHATRGATRSLLVDLATAATTDFASKPSIPTYMPAVMGAKANNAPPSATPLSAAEADQDLAVMMRNTNGDDPYNNKLLERAMAPTPQVEYQYRPPSSMPDLHESNTSMTSSFFPPGLGGVAMSAQSSAAGHSEFGAPMSRNASSIGASAMKRTASSTGLLGVGEGSRRIRPRT